MRQSGGLDGWKLIQLLWAAWVVAFAVVWFSRLGFTLESILLYIFTTLPVSVLSFPVSAVIGVTISVFFSIYCYITVLWIRDFILSLIGSKTLAEIISSEPTWNDGDNCMQGIYIYIDRDGRTYQAKFIRGVHYPSNDEWQELVQTYRVGARYPVRYLPPCPIIHNISFPKVQRSTVE